MLEFTSFQGTVTGRLSSSKPFANESNTPKPDGMCLALLNLDFSDLERRVAAHSGRSLEDVAQNPYGQSPTAER